MKTLLLFLTLILTFNLSAQWSRDNDKFNLKDPSKSVPVLIMFGGFAYNEVILNQPKFENYTQKEMNKVMLTGYLSTAVLSIGSRLIIRGVQNKKRHKHFFDI
jgi:hypothetical protein